MVALWAAAAACMSIAATAAAAVVSHLAISMITYDHPSVHTCNGSIMASSPSRRSTPACRPAHAPAWPTSCAPAPRPWWTRHSCCRCSGCSWTAGGWALGCTPRCGLGASWRPQLWAAQLIVAAPQQQPGRDPCQYCLVKHHPHPHSRTLPQVPRRLPGLGADAAVPGDAPPLGQRGRAGPGDGGVRGSSSAPSSASSGGGGAGLAAPPAGIRPGPLRTFCCAAGQQAPRQVARSGREAAAARIAEAAHRAAGGAREAVHQELDKRSDEVQGVAEHAAV
jgi:hypothetical protein